jgi:DNA-binding beta-propeller fold protein YncE
MYRSRLAKGIVTALFKGVASAVALAAGVPALAAPSLPFPTYSVGPQADGSIVMSTNQTITPAGTLLKSVIWTRAKAIALNPNPTSHTAAVLQMGVPEEPQLAVPTAVVIFDLVSGQSLQNFSPGADFSGSFTGITYSADGSKLIFSQASDNLAVATVDTTTGLITGAIQVPLPSPQFGDSYPGGLALSADGTTAYVVLDKNNTLGVVDLTRLSQRWSEKSALGTLRTASSCRAIAPMLVTKADASRGQVISPMFLPVRRSFRIRKPTPPGPALSR